MQEHETNIVHNIAPRILFEKDWRTHMYELDARMNKSNSSPSRVLLDIALKGLGDEIVVLCYLPETGTKGERYATWVCRNDGKLITTSGNYFRHDDRKGAEENFVTRQDRR